MRAYCFLVALVAPSALGAQATLSTSAELRATPTGSAIASVRAGTGVVAGATRGSLTRITLEGFVHQSVLAGRRDSFPISIKPGSPALLRQSPSPSAAVRATLRGGMGLSEIARNGEWRRVRRTGWVPSKALRLETTPATVTPVARSRSDTMRDAEQTAESAGSVTIDSAGREPPPAGSLTPARQLTIRTAPDGEALASVAPGTPLVPLARERGWVRVRMHGWVRESEVIAADTAVRTSLSAADLRADPVTLRGVVVRWEVQILSTIQRADPLRRDLARDEPYILARGPREENSLLYLAVPPSLLTSVRSLPALTQAVITARVRNGRSDPVGVPILDLQSIVRK